MKTEDEQFRYLLDTDYAKYAKTLIQEYDDNYLLGLEATNKANDFIIEIVQIGVAEYNNHLNSIVSANEASNSQKTYAAKHLISKEIGMNAIKEYLVNCFENQSFK
jgi:hypothetical protein